MTAQTVLVLQEPRAAALALDPVRRRILEHLRSPDSAAGVARHLRLPRQKVNYHLRELERHGLVRLVEERRRGNCVERRVAAAAPGLIAAARAVPENAPAPDRLLAPPRAGLSAALPAPRGNGEGEA